jgi:hypothetical protein
MYLTIKHHALNTYKGTPNGGEWVDSRLGRFTTVKRAPPQSKSWVGPKQGWVLRRGEKSVTLAGNGTHS